MDSQCFPRSSLAGIWPVSVKTIAFSPKRHVGGGRPRVQPGVRPFAANDALTAEGGRATQGYAAMTILPLAWCPSMCATASAAWLSG